MIIIDKNYHNNPACDKEFIKLIEFFNDLEEKLRYPFCDGKTEELMMLRQAQNKLIQLGYL